MGKRSRNTDEGGLDLLISNAGILTPGPLEVLPLSAIRHEFEVNVFGALAVAKTATALKRAAERMTAEQRELYGKAFDTFAKTLNKMQASGLDSTSAARRVIELAEQVPAPSRGAVGADAEEILRLVREKSDAEQDAIRLHMVGLES